LIEAEMVVTRESAQGKELLCFLVKNEELWANENLRIMFGRKTKREIGLFVAGEPRSKYAGNRQRRGCRGGHGPLSSAEP
jgi:hypothetical protein